MESTEIEKRIKNNSENYNIFSVLRIEHKELIHSQFLKHLFNPTGRHGQKDKLFRSFIEEFCQDVEKKEIWKSAKYRVKTEQTLKNESKELGRADIWINCKDENEYIIIENKLFAGDQKNQLLRYNEYLNEGKNEKGKRKGILFYLTLNGKVASLHSKGSDDKLVENQHYHPISYSDLNKWLKNQLVQNKFSDSFTTFLKQYIDTVDKLVLKYEIIEIIKAETNYIEAIAELNKNEIVRKYLANEKIQEHLYAELELKPILH